MLEQNALAAAAAPDDGDRFAVFNPKGDVLQDFLRAETFLQLADFNHRAQNIKARPNCAKNKLRLLQNRHVGFRQKAALRDVTEEEQQRFKTIKLLYLQEFGWH